MASCKDTFHMCPHTDTLHSPKATQIDYSTLNFNLDNIYL